MYRATTALIAAFGIASVSAAGDLCLNSAEQWEICLTGTPIQKTVPQALYGCKFTKAWNDVNKKCPKFAALNKALKAADTQANCMLNKLKLYKNGAVDKVEVAFVSGSLPNSMLEMFSYDKIDKCARRLNTMYGKNIKKCKYKASQNKTAKNAYNKLSYVQCAVEQLADNCSAQAKILLKALMEGLLSITNE